MNTNNLEDWIGDNVFAGDLPRWLPARSHSEPATSNFSKSADRSVAAITFFVLAGSQNAMNGLGTFSLSLFGVDVSRVLVPCEHILEGSEHVNADRPALPA
ncbi:MULTISPECIES: hypothetical protein [unclassified Rhodococcus (in: high G+C Gram-positive bacteria)]|uniref:hypothetical protein n=1 Tax=unclassified Rhodococcus (in: high G+C Gram-positive bacteria) TaxID=192944 RepID=UPI00031FB95F|nr:hypothetical protein [Rhodococcus sp. DK17]